MKLKKLALFACMAVTAAALLSGCGADNTAKSAPKLDTIHMTYVKSPLNIPSIVEKHDQVFEKGFEKDGIKIVYSDLDAGPKQTEAMAAGSIDITHALGGTSAILAAANGVDVKIIGMYSRAPEAFTIMTQDPSIQSIADLKGKTIAGPKGTILHQLLLTALEKNGMTAEDVQFVSMGIPQGAAALLNGSADAALIAGPQTLKLQQEGARILTTGKGLLDASIVIAVRGDFLKNYPEAVKKFMDLHRGVVQSYLADPSTTYAAAMEETGLTQEQIQSMAPWYDFDPSIKDSDIEDLNKTQDFLIQTGMLEKDKKIDIRSILSPVQ